MNYTNDKIKQLIEERDREFARFNAEIQKEIQKERANYRFSWKRLGLLLMVIIMPLAMVKINSKIFPKSSIWSWSHYIK